MEEWKIILLVVIIIIVIILLIVKLIPKIKTCILMATDRDNVQNFQVELQTAEIKNELTQLSEDSEAGLGGGGRGEILDKANKDIAQQLENYHELAKQHRQKNPVHPDQQQGIFDPKDPNDDTETKSQDDNTQTSENTSQQITTASKTQKLENRAPSFIPVIENIEFIKSDDEQENSVQPQDVSSNSSMQISKIVVDKNRGDAPPTFMQSQILTKSATEQSTEPTD